ncbi:MAG: DivIVA domain-containing protein [Clostridia bacterium]|nr:DivIVA domain-containing protein [Clostridia bacterium]
MNRDDVINKVFPHSLFGYDPVAVDAFLDEVIREFDRMTNSIDVLKLKLTQELGEARLTNDFLNAELIKLGFEQRVEKLPAALLIDESVYAEEKDTEEENTEGKNTEGKNTDENGKEETDSAELAEDVETAEAAYSEPAEAGDSQEYGSNEPNEQADAVNASESGEAANCDGGRNEAEEAQAEQPQPEEKRKSRKKHKH